MISTHKIRLWRGTRNAYNALATAGEIDSSVYYSVKEADGTWSSFFGSSRNCHRPGQVEPVEKILKNGLSSIYEEAAPGKRYLVNNDGDYFVVEMADDGNESGCTMSELYRLGNRSVRIETMGSKEYQVVNGELITYDDVDCGMY